MDSGAGEKRQNRVKPTCHCEASSQTGCGNPHPLCTTPKSRTYQRRNGFPRRCAPRNDRGFLYIAFSFPKWHFLYPGDPSVGLTPASSPKRGAKGEVLPRSAAPPRGSPQCAHWGKWSPEGGLEQGGKERAEYRINLSLRDQCAHRSWQSASPMHCTKNTLPTRGGTDSHVASLLGMTVVFYTSLCLFPNGTFSALATPQSALRPPAPLRGAPRAPPPTPTTKGDPTCSSQTCPRPP